MRKAKMFIVVMAAIMAFIAGCSGTDTVSLDTEGSQVKESESLVLSERIDKKNAADESEREKEELVSDIPMEKDNKDGPEPDIYDEAHGFRDDLSDEEPEGAETYEIDEAPPMYRVDVRNINVMSDVYNDYENCNLLRLALQNYLDMTLEEPGSTYSVELVDGSCKDGDIMTFEAHIDGFMGITLYIEYDKAAKQFGIDSEMMDASLKVLRGNQ